jgi:molybdopterin converting factor small subunit
MLVQVRNADHTKISDILRPFFAICFLFYNLCILKLTPLLLKDIVTMNISPKIPAGQFTILYFASASSYTSKDSETLEAPLPLSKLFETLEERYSGFKTKVLESCLVTINLEYVDISNDTRGASNEVVIKEGDEVAIIPPVSSG